MSVRRRTFLIATGLIFGFWSNPALSQPAAAPPVTARRENPQVFVPPILKIPPLFYLHSYLGKCLDYGTAQIPGTQVYVSDCNASAEQQILVEEVDAQHDVVLHAGNLVLGVRPPPLLNALAAVSSAATLPSSSFVLELQQR